MYIFIHFSAWYKVNIFVQCSRDTIKREANIWTVSEIFIYDTFIIYIFIIYILLHMFITYACVSIYIYSHTHICIYRRTMLKTIFPTKETEKQPEYNEVNDL